MSEGLTIGMLFCLVGFALTKREWWLVALLGLAILLILTTTRR